MSVENSFDDNSDNGLKISTSDIEDNKTISKGKVFELIKQFNLNYNNNETENLLEEIGYNKQETIILENLIEKSKEQRKSSKFIEFYDKILNLFITPYEKIIQILNEVKDKLTIIKELRMVNDIQWIIKKLNNDDIYNLNFEQLKTTSNLNENQEFENAFNFISEYSSDAFTKHKKEDINAVRRISDERSALEHSSQALSLTRKSMLNTSISNFNFSPDIKKAIKTSLTYDKSNKFNLENSNKGKILDLRLSDNIAIKEEDDDMKVEKVSDVNDSDENDIIKLENLDKKSSLFNENTQIRSSLLNNVHVIDNDRLNVRRVSTYLELDHINKQEFMNEAELIQADALINIDSRDFSVFEYSNTFGRENVLINVSDYIFHKYRLYPLIDQRRFETFIDKIRLGYDYLLPYHNDLHACDVLQTCFIFSEFSDLKAKIDITMIDLAGFLIAAIIHDYKHPGLNNMYHINKKTNYAIKYNDVSVLENYHVSSAFKVISHPNSNIFCHLHVEEYRIMRKRIVECVLATDMAKHTKSQSSLKMKIEQVKNNNNNNNFNDNVISNLMNFSVSEENKFDRQQEILNFLIHCSDISNQTKSFELCKKWTELVTDEFFNQGDLEKQEKLPVSFLCDRTTTNIPKSQISFITNIVLPCYKVMIQLLPSCEFMVKNLYINLENWRKEFDETNNIKESNSNKEINNIKEINNSKENNNNN